MSDCQDHKQNIIKKLRIIFRTVQAYAKSVEEQYGLSGAKLSMLSTVNGQPGIRVSHLAHALTIHPSTCSNMLDQLEKKGLVRRRRSKTDQRTVHLYLTDEGARMLSNAPAPLQGKLSQALEALDKEKLKVLDSGLNDLLAGMEVKKEKAGVIPLTSSDV